MQRAITYGIGGENTTENLEGRERYPMSVRYAPDFRDDVDKLRRSPQNVRFIYGKFIVMASIQPSSREVVVYEIEDGSLRFSTVQRTSTAVSWTSRNPSLAQAVEQFASSAGAPEMLTSLERKSWKPHFLGSGPFKLANSFWAARLQLSAVMRFLFSAQHRNVGVRNQTPVTL